ncbi:2,4-dienoyl-CoA reductase-like NADH-dependent reductase (Old Yellow Enzyme family) [Neisseria perflava]|nr:2,4-dienoyl-CoA reductase-like NADH-dependent reductase (Old Yellow Enzyme family) [Neisseria perflava]
MTDPKYAKLFTPYTLNNGVTIKNRMVVAPMTHWASNEDGTFSAEEQRFIGNRAQDFGMFILAASLVLPEGKSFVGEPGVFGEQHLAGLQQAAQTIKNQGAKAVIQLHHGGAKLAAALIGQEAAAPSAVSEEDFQGR